LPVRSELVIVGHLKGIQPPVVELLSEPDGHQAARRTSVSLVLIPEGVCRLCEKSPADKGRINMLEEEFPRRG
jgi:hypothetical protein